MVRTDQHYMPYYINKYVPMGSIAQATGGNKNDEWNRCLRNIIIPLTIQETKTYVPFWSVEIGWKCLYTKSLLKYICTVNINETISLLLLFITLTYPGKCELI